MVPTKLSSTRGGFELRVDSDDRSKAAALVGIPDGDARHHVTVAAWNGHNFEAVRFYIYDMRRSGTKYVAELYAELAPTDPTAYEARMFIHYPLDPRITAADIHGGTWAEANDDNDGWLIHQGDADHMHDREIEIRAGIVAVFQPQVDDLLESLLIATDTKPSDWPIGTPWESRATRRLKWQRLLEFREKATDCALEEARKRSIGWYHRNHHESHLHHLVHDCITTTLVATGETYASIHAEVRNAAVSLALHKYETPWAQRARLKKEAEAAAAAATDSASETEQ